MIYRGILGAAFTLVVLAKACTPQASEYLQKEDSDFILKVKTTACLGKCPIYELTLQSDGQAHFVGERFTEIEGEVDKKLPQREIDSLKTIFVENEFFALDSVYNDPGITDLPSTTIILTSEDGQFSKKVYSRTGQPENLQHIEAYLARLRKRHFTSR